MNHQIAAREYDKRVAEEKHGQGLRRYIRVLSKVRLAWNSSLCAQREMRNIYTRL